jgi:regulatory protein
MSHNAIDPLSLRMVALNYLALREHSAQELHDKLMNKFGQKDLVLEQIEKLKAEGLQDDQRFAAAFTQMRFRQGKGSRLISLELKARGVCADLIEQSLAVIAQQSDWNTAALTAYRKKFGNNPIVNLKEKARVVRFLTYRGFSSANIHAVFNQYLAEVN